MNDTPMKSDIIFVPSASKSAITERAAQLFCSGYADHVLPSGMYSSNSGRLAGENMENAAFSAIVLKDLGVEVNKAILCCKSFHARRAFMSYACHFPGAEILVVPTDTQGITKGHL